MLLILYVSTIIYLLFFKRKQKYTWLLVACLMSLLSITSNSYADLDNYSPLFDYLNLSSTNIFLSTTDLLWAVLCKLFYSLGFNYRGMIIGLLFINYYLLHKAAKNFKCNENVFFGLFLIFPAVIQLVQLKFFTATTLVFLAYSILIKDEKYSTIQFFTLILMSFLIHKSTFIFIFLFLTKTNRINNQIIFALTVILMIGLSLNVNFFANFTQNFLTEAQFTRYVANTITPSSNLWIALIFFSWLACYFIGIFVSKLSKFDSNIQVIYKKNVMVFTLLLMTIPLLLLDRNMHRFLEVGYTILFSMIAILVNDRKFSLKHKLTTILVTGMVLLCVMYIYTPYGSILKPLFSYDRIIEIRR